MKLQKFSDTTGCYGKYCPAVYKTDRGTFVVQGNLLADGDAAAIALAPNEGVVEVPEALLRSLATRLTNKG